MGVRRLGDELRRARGTLSQKAAAAHFGVSYSTLCVIEQGKIVDKQGKVRHFQSHTLAQFDTMIGKSAWEVYVGPDEPVVDELTARLEALEARLAGFEETVGAALTRSPSAIERLTAELDDAERDQVVAYIHFLLSRRIRGSA